MIHLIFNLALRGRSIRAIVRELETLGVPSPRGRRLWQHRTVHRILSNPAYAGTSYYNRLFRPEGAPPGARRLRPEADWIAVPVPPIVSREIVNRVAAQLQRNRELSPRRQRRFYLLKGLVRCGACGRPLAGQCLKRWRHYVCRGRLLPVPEQRCPAPRVTANRLEGAVWQRVARLLSQPELILEEARRHREGRVGQRDEMLMRVDYVRTALEKLPVERERVQTMYREGYLELDGLRAQLDAVERKRAALDEERRVLEARLKTVTAGEAEQARLEEVTARLAGRLSQLTDAERYEVVHAFIERITISLDGTVDLRAYVPAGRSARRSYVRTAWAVPGPLE